MTDRAVGGSEGVEGGGGRHVTTTTQDGNTLTCNSHSMCSRQDRTTLADCPTTYTAAAECVQTQASALVTFTPGIVCTWELLLDETRGGAF